MTSDGDTVEVGGVVVVGARAGQEQSVFRTRKRKRAISARYVCTAALCSLRVALKVAIVVVVVIVLVVAAAAVSVVVVVVLVELVVSSTCVCRLALTCCMRASLDCVIAYRI